MVWLPTAMHERSDTHDTDRSAVSPDLVVGSGDRAVHSPPVENTASGISTL